MDNNFYNSNYNQSLFYNEKKNNEIDIENQSTISNLNNITYNNNENKNKDQIFDIVKIQKINDKKINSIFNNANNDTIFSPFFNINSNNNNNNLINNNIDNNKITIKNDPHSNYNQLLKENFPKNINNNKRNSLIDNNFHPKFIKKENVDKKIFRFFRNFIKEKSVTENNIVILKNSSFWINFSQKNLLPPMRYIDNNNNVIFKSFNSNYFIWLFSQEGTNELFNQFLKEEGNLLLNKFIMKYNLKNDNEEISNLKKYLFNIPNIYRNINNSDNNINNFNRNEDNNVEDRKNSFYNNEADIFLSNNNIYHNNINDYNFINEENSDNYNDNNNNQNIFNLNFNLYNNNDYDRNSSNINSFY